jgi:hypothetical protein
MTHLLAEVVRRVETLPSHEQERIARRWMQDVPAAESTSPSERTPGLGKGTIRMASDFDAPVDFVVGIVL